MEKQTTGFLKNEEDIILQQMEELKKDLEALQRLRAKYSHPANFSPIRSNGNGIAIVPDEYTTNQLEIPDVYDKDALTWEERCIFILNSLGKATVEDVIKKIQEYEPEVTDVRAKNVATNKLSKLYRNKKVKADTSGKRYKYYL